MITEITKQEMIDRIFGTGWKKREVIETTITWLIIISLVIIIFCTHIEKLGHNARFLIVPLLIHIMILKQFGVYKRLTKGK